MLRGTLNKWINDIKRNIMKLVYNKSTRSFSKSSNYALLVWDKNNPTNCKVVKVDKAKSLADAQDGADAYAQKNLNENQDYKVVSI